MTMGTPIPPIIEPPPVDAGDACSICWGVGKPFGDLETPSVVVIDISGINKGVGWTPAYGEPTKGRYALGQTILGACQWIHHIDNVLIEFRFDAFDTFLNVTTDKGFFCLIHASGPPCQLEVENLLSVIFTGGTAVITIPEINE